MNANQHCRHYYTGDGGFGDGCAYCEIERLRERYAELDTYADHTNRCHVNESGDHATCDCGYVALMVTDRKPPEQINKGLCVLHSWGAPPGQDQLECPYCNGLLRTK